MARALAFARKHLNHIIVLGAIIAWAVAFESGWARSESTGFWARRTELRGDAVAIRGEQIETAAQRERRLARQTSELEDELSDLRKDYLGGGKRTEGVDPRFRPSIPRDVARYTQRDACIQMKMEFPERFGDVDCFSDRYDDAEPWFRVPRTP